MYDLKQFANLISGQIDATSLKVYENQLKDWKPSVQKRKRSAVNQFLRYLYQKGDLSEFLTLSEIARVSTQEEELERLELLALYEGQEGPGKLACLFILELGLLPSEFLELDWADIDLAFGIVTVAKGSTKRVLRLDGALKQSLLMIKNENSPSLVNGCISKFRLMLLHVDYLGSPHRFCDSSLFLDRLKRERAPLNWLVC